MLQQLQFRKIYNVIKIQQNFTFVIEVQHNPKSIIVIDSFFWSGVIDF